MAEALPSTAAMLDHALGYLARGWSIFPVCTPVPGTSRCHQHVQCDNPGKAPLVKWKAFQTERASEQTIRGWWSRWPTANIGLATGALSGVVVVDLDGDLATREALSREVDVGPWAYTGRVGGRHLYFAYRDDAPTIYAKPKTVGIDFRGQGGYVLLPPSLHQSGNRYRWAESPDTELPALPRWVDELGRQSDGFIGTNGTTVSGEHIDVQHLVEHGVPEGQRDQELFRLASKLRGADIPYDLAIDIVEQAAERCSPPFPADQARAKVASAYKRYQPNTEVPRVRLNGYQVVDPVTGEVSDDWQWTVYDAPDFLNRDIPAVEWLVEDYIREQAIVGNFGGPGTLKTYFMSQLALSVATGERFLGRFATRQAKVLIVQEDTLEADYQQVYLRPMFQTLRVAQEDTRGWLYIAPPSDFLLDIPKRLAALEYWLAEHRPALVCMDAFYLLHTGEGMTSKDLQPVLTTLKRIRKTYGCAFWLLDHNRKSSGSPSTDESAIDRWYGGRSKSAASDTVIETRAEKNEDGVSTFHALKMRGARLPAPLRVRLVDGALVIDEEQSADASEGTKTLIVEWLLTQASGRTLNDIKVATRLSHRHVQRAAGELAKEGRLQKTGRAGRADLWQLTEQVQGINQEALWG